MNDSRVIVLDTSGNPLNLSNRGGPDLQSIVKKSKDWWDFERKLKLSTNCEGAQALPLFNAYANLQYFARA